jgi:hypothetical protein
MRAGAEGALSGPKSAAVGEADETANFAAGLPDAADVPGRARGSGTGLAPAFDALVLASLFPALLSALWGVLCAGFAAAGNAGMRRVPDSSRLASHVSLVGFIQKWTLASAKTPRWGFELPAVFGRIGLKTPQIRVFGPQSGLSSAAASRYQGGTREKAPEDRHEYRHDQF